MNMARFWIKFSRSPFHRTASPGLCWVCNRHIGPALTCSYCDAAQPFRSARLAARVIALTIALIGITTLLGTAQRRLPARPSHINQISLLTPFIGTRIEGRIIRNSFSSPVPQGLHLQDASGTIRIALDRAIGPGSPRRSSSFRTGQHLAILGSGTIDSKGRPVFYGLKWALLPPPSRSTP